MLSVVVNGNDASSDREEYAEGPKNLFGHESERSARLPGQGGPVLRSHDWAPDSPRAGQWAGKWPLLPGSPDNTHASPTGSVLRGGVGNDAPGRSGDA